MREKECEGVRPPERENGGDGSRQAVASEWQLVHRKETEQAKKWLDVARNYNWFSKDARRTTYFFTNFPEHLLAKHMLKEFLKYGEFEEVVIPPKRDKRGWRFGFARAVNVKDPDRFAVTLDNMFIGNYKIMVNLSRFSRDDNHGGKPIVATCVKKKTLASIIVDPKAASLPIADG